jgi:hypothetical protein
MVWREPAVSTEFSPAVLAGVRQCSLVAAVIAARHKFPYDVLRIKYSASCHPGGRDGAGCPLLVRGDPEDRLPVLPDLLYPVAETGASCGPLFCRFSGSILKLFSKNTGNFQDFPCAWTAFPVQPENGIAGLPNGERIGLI